MKKILIASFIIYFLSTMKKLPVFLFLVFSMTTIVTSVNAENVLYCESELATGFAKINGTWKEQHFVLNRYTIKFNKDYTKLKGLDEFLDFTCRKVFDRVEIIYCLSDWLDGDTFQYNPKNNRFKYMNPSSSGFIEPEQNDTDVFYAGTCKSF